MNAEMLNLLPPERRRAMRLRRRAQVWTLAAAAYGLAAAGACITLAAGEPDIDRGEAAALDTTRREATDAKEEAGRMQQELNTLHKTLGAARLIADHPDWSELLAMLGTERSDEVVLEGVRIEPVKAEKAGDADRPRTKAEEALDVRADVYMVTIEGFGRTQLAVTQFADALQRADVFEGVTLKGSRSRALGELSVVQFDVECRLGSGPRDGAKGAKR